MKVLIIAELLHCKMEYDGTLVSNNHDSSTTAASYMDVDFKSAKRVKIN